jgi:glycogen debranching enzyme
MRLLLPRHGYVVEVNALWYNAVSYALELARSAKDNDFIAKWEHVPEQIQASFNQEFWNPELGYLADYVTDGKQDMSIRPNQVIAASLPYTPLKEVQRKSILDIITKYLVTPRGLRTLSPNDDRYIGHYEGDVISRDMALHQGTVWPWLLGHYAETYLSIYGKSGISYIENLFDGFEACMKEHGIGSISEIFDGNPPHLPKGSISFAPSVAELARIQAMLHNTQSK